MTKVIWKSYNPDRSPRLFGDQVMLDDVFTKLGFESVLSFRALDSGEGAIVTLPLEDNKERIGELNADIEKLPWCLVILTQNEYASNAYLKIKHPNMKLWLQSPSANDVADRFLGFGYPSMVSDYVISRKRDNNWFFAGQITHNRRRQCALALSKREDGIFIPTSHFNDGLSYEEYVATMCRSKIVLCPAGPQTPDTFRVYEALEAGCIPIVDSRDGRSEYRQDYWEKVFGLDAPIYLVDDWTTDINQILDTEIADYEARSVEVSTWWKRYKRGFNEDLINTVKGLEARA